MLKKSYGLCAVALLVFVCACPSSARAQADLPVSTPAPAAPAPVAPAAAMPTGDDLLHSVIAYLQKQRSWYAEVTATSTLTLSGMERSNVTRSRVWMRRPHHVVWTNQGDSGNSAMALDGDECILYLPSLMRYTSTPYSGTADDHLLPMSSLLGPVASTLLAADPTTAALTQMLSGPVVLVGVEHLLSIPCYHLQLPTITGDVELWIAAGSHPLPVRVRTAQVVRNTSASPAGDAMNGTDIDFRWRINVQLPESTWKLNLPETAKRMDVLGGPNLAAASRSPSKSGKKNTTKQKAAASEPKGSRSLGLAFDPPPVIGSNGSLPPLAQHADVPSLSGGVAGTDLRQSGETQSKAVQKTQDFQPSSQAAPTAPATTQSFSPPPVAASQMPRQVQVSNPAPDVELPLIDGGKVRLSTLRGKKAVVLDFWATWCGPCQQAMPAVADAARAWKSRGVDFYAVNMAEAPEEVRSFSRKQGLSIPVAMDRDGSLAAAFGVSGIPHLVVIGRDGGIRGVHTGADRNLRQTLDRELETAL